MSGNVRSWVILFTLITAFIHILIGFPGIPFGLDTLLLLNGIGYLVLLWLWLNPPAALSRGLVTWVFMAYTAVTIIAYFAVWGADGLRSPVGMLTKVDEALLIAALFKSRG